jgi:hypothetical protein
VGLNSGGIRKERGRLLKMKNLDLSAARFYIRNVGTEIQLKRDLQLCSFRLKNNAVTDRRAVHQVFSGRINTSEPARPLKINGFWVWAERCLGVLGVWLDYGRDERAVGGFGCYGRFSDSRKSKLSEHPTE